MAPPKPKQPFSADYAKQFFGIKKEKNRLNNLLNLSSKTSASALRRFSSWPGERSVKSGGANYQWRRTPFSEESLLNQLTEKSLLHTLPILRQSAAPLSPVALLKQQLKTELEENATIGKGVHKPVQFGLSLSGCGFLGTYHFGVMICFQKNAKNLMSKVTHFGGASAGSLLAALLVLAPQSLEDGLLQLYELADELNSLPLGAMTPGFQLALRLANIVDKFMPQDISSAEGRLFVSLTQQSLYSMGIYGTPPEIDNELYIDGGYSNNLPIFDNIPTITVSPFSGSAIITPTDVNSMFDWKMQLANQNFKVNLNNVVRGAQALFPPSRAVLTAYFDMGFRNAMKFLLDNEFYEREEGNPV